MKLNPPASSSDLAAARAIARRLHERALQNARHDAPPPTPRPPEPAVPPADLDPPAPEREPLASEPESPAPPRPEVDEFEIPEAKAPAPPPVVTDAEEEPETLDLAPPDESPWPDQPPVPESPLTDPGGPGASYEDDSDGPVFETPEPEPPELETPAFDPSVAEPPVDSPQPDEPFSDDSAAAVEEPISPEAAAAEDAWAAEAEDALRELAGPATASLEGSEPPPVSHEEDPGAGVENLLGGAPADDEQVPELPFDVMTDPDAADSPDDLLGSPEPSWDDVAEACMALAGAHGAMLVDTSGQVLTARGEWPEPGPDAIAGRLVSMMDRTLQEAPTRSVSAPIAGQHLTAWRIPAHEGYFTAVFMGDAPLSTDVRPDIDEHIRRALDR
jgi:hypothetical protein